MDHRPLCGTVIELPVLGFGASSIGAEFRPIDLNDALKSVHVALDRGMNDIDAAAYYSGGMSELMLGRILTEIPRD